MFFLCCGLNKEKKLFGFIFKFLLNNLLNMIVQVKLKAIGDQVNRTESNVKHYHLKYLIKRNNLVILSLNAVLLINRAHVCVWFSIKNNLIW